MPEPLEPAAGTLEFDAERGGRVGPRRCARGCADRASRAPRTRPRPPTSSRERFEEIVSGTVAEQTVDASVDGEDVELRNVLLTLPGTTDRAIVVIAGRDSRGRAPGRASSAAATGVLLELAAEPRRGGARADR